VIHRELHVDGSSDVAVVGAGPGGSTAAAFLARAGLHTLLLDKARFPRDKACGDAVCTKSLAYLAFYGLDQPQLAQNTHSGRLDFGSAT